MTRVFISQDASSLSVGADAVARAIARLAGTGGHAITIIRTGSRGLMWLEPLVEVETTRGRLAYGPVRPEDVPDLMAADLLNGGDHRLALGPIEDLPWWKRQTRLTFARCGLVDPLSLAGYEAHGGGAGLARALTLTPAEVIDEVAESGLRGRGGAGFPTGIKWRTVAAATAPRKYVVCNADEGDSGTFADRMILEGDPFAVIEGMIIAGLATGASHGIIYLRAEYPHARRTLTRAIATARGAGWLGASVLRSGRPFDMDLFIGAGAYICGEETALLESLEGRRGMVRAKPPLPALDGLFGRPTVINNVISLASVPVILAEGKDFYRSFGSGRSRGTLPVQLGGNVRRGGLFEVPFGLTLDALINDIGGGTASGRPVRAVQVGGPLGAYFPAALLDTPLDYEAMAAAGGLLGHGGVVVFDDTVDLAAQARFAMEFCAAESCGKCTPCRIGSTRGVEVIDRIRQGDDRAGNHALLVELCETMRDASLCGLGGLTPSPVLSALEHFPEDFHRPAVPGEAAEQTSC